MESEIWKAHPDIPGVQVSTLGRVRTLDRLESSEERTQFTKGHVLKQYNRSDGYLCVSIKVDGKWTFKKVHRLVAQTFLPNPNSFPMINHKDCNRKNNNVSNIEWCDNSYNMKYREKFGKAAGIPVFAIKLKTLEVSRYPSQIEASRKLGVDRPSINMVIRGKQKQAGGFWFKADDGNGIEIDKDKLHDIADSIPFTGGIFAVNLNTSEVSRFKSQIEASHVLGIYQGSISNVIKGKSKRAGGYWFVNADEHALDIVKHNLHDIGKTGLNIKLRV